MTITDETRGATSGRRRRRPTSCSPLCGGSRRRA